MVFRVLMAGTLILSGCESTNSAPDPPPPRDVEVTADVGVGDAEVLWVDAMLGGSDPPSICMPLAEVTAIRFGETHAIQVELGSPGLEQMPCGPGDALISARGVARFQLVGRGVYRFTAPAGTVLQARRHCGEPSTALVDALDGALCSGSVDSDPTLWVEAPGAGWLDILVTSDELGTSDESVDRVEVTAEHVVLAPPTVKLDLIRSDPDTDRLGLLAEVSWPASTPPAAAQLTAFELVLTDAADRTVVLERQPLRADAGLAVEKTCEAGECRAEVRGVFEVISEIFGWPDDAALRAPGDALARVELRLFDLWGNTLMVLARLEDLPEPQSVGANEECDPTNLFIRCDSELVCGINLDGARCRGPSPGPMAPPATAEFIVRADVGLVGVRLDGIDWHNRPPLVALEVLPYGDLTGDGGEVSIPLVGHDPHRTLAAQRDDVLRVPVMVREGEALAAIAPDLTLACLLEVEAAWIRCVEQAPEDGCAHLTRRHDDCTRSRRGESGVLGRITRGEVTLVDALQNRVLSLEVPSMPGPVSVETEAICDRPGLVCDRPATITSCPAEFPCHAAEPHEVPTCRHIEMECPGVEPLDWLGGGHWRGLSDGLDAEPLGEGAPCGGGGPMIVYRVEPARDGLHRATLHAAGPLVFYAREACVVPRAAPTLGCDAIFGQGERGEGPRCGVPERSESDAEFTTRATFEFEARAGEPVYLFVDAGLGAMRPHRVDIGPATPAP